MTVPEHFVILAADSSYSYFTVRAGSCSHRGPCFDFSGWGRKCLSALAVAVLASGSFDRFTVTSQSPESGALQV
jgi:hypothetical protein